LKLNYDEALSNFAFKFKLRRFIVVGRRRLIVSNPELKAHLASAISA
jgi:hypothetical protein